MIEFDIKTLFLLFTTVNIFILLFFVSYVIFYKVKVPIINLFIFSRFIGVIAAILLFLKGSIPEIFSVKLFNILLLFHLFYEVYSISFINHTFNLKKFKRLSLIPLFLSIVFLLFIAPSSEGLRIIFISLCLVIIYTFGTVTIILDKTKTKIQDLTSYLFSFVAFLFLARFVFTFLGNNASIFTSNYIQISAYIFSLLLNFFIPGFFLFILKENDNQIIEEDNIKLRELVKSKDKFFTIIAHDLRGPLGNLQQIGKMLWEHEINAKSRQELTKKLYESAENTYNLLDNLLNWARANSDDIQHNPKQVNLKQLILENINLFKSQSELKNLNLTSNLKDGLSVFTDYEMINTVIRNLISNAIKFTANSGKIEITSANETSNTHTIIVSDNGVGMSKDIILKVFEIDSTISTLGTENEKGTGFGLKLCNEFIKRNKGHIIIESEQNIGTRIFITLPKKNNIITST